MSTPVTLVLIVAIVVLFVLGSGLDYTLARIWAFQRKRLRLATIPTRAQLLTRFGRVRRYHVDLRDIRDLVISLQLGTSMDQTLSGALTRAAQQFKDRGELGGRLWKHVQTRLSIAPEEVISGLAEDFHSAQLTDLLQRLEMARDGGISYERALSLTVTQIEDEIRGDLRRDIQKLPIDLTLPMIAAVFLPAVMIGLFPIVATFMAQLSVRFVGPGG